MFSDQAKSLGNLNTATFWRSFLNLWNQVDEEWHSLCSKMADGTILIAQAEKVFRLFQCDNKSTYRQDELQK